MYKHRPKHNFVNTMARRGAPPVQNKCRVFPEGAAWSGFQSRPSISVGRVKAQGTPPNPAEEEAQQAPEASTRFEDARRRTQPRSFVPHPLPERQATGGARRSPPPARGAGADERGAPRAEPQDLLALEPHLLAPRVSAARRPRARRRERRGRRSEIYNTEKAVCLRVRRGPSRGSSGGRSSRGSLELLGAPDREPRRL